MMNGPIINHRFVRLLCVFSCTVLLVICHHTNLIILNIPRWAHIVPVA